MKVGRHLRIRIVIPQKRGRTVRATELLQRIGERFAFPIDRLKALQVTSPLQARYGLDLEDLTGESYIKTFAEQKIQGNRERAARQILNDFRKGTLGAIALELPPESGES